MLLGSIYILFFLNDGLLIQTFGLALGTMSVLIVNSQNFSKRKKMIKANDAFVTANASRGPGLLMWGTGIALLIATGIAFFLLYQSAIGGYKEGWPLYLFTIVGFISGIFWAVLISKYIWRP
jgi:hypothetical protein